MKPLFAAMWSTQSARTYAWNVHVEVRCDAPIDRKPLMKPYRDPDRDSGVIAYDDGPGFIIVMFKGSSWKYEFTDVTTGAGHVAEMRRLAALGDGLNRYINLHVKTRYARKYR